jgi:hypothetical protein
MRTRLRSLGFALTVLVVGVLGCQRLNFEKNFDMAPGDLQAALIDAPKADQQVTVEITSSSGPVDVYVILEEDRTAVTEKLKAYKKPDASQIKASKEKMESGTLEATIPAGKAFAVLLARATKKTDVKVKIKG